MQPPLPLFMRWKYPGESVIDADAGLAPREIPATAIAMAHSEKKVARIACICLCPYVLDLEDSVRICARSLCLKALKRP